MRIQVIACVLLTPAGKVHHCVGGRERRSAAGPIDVLERNIQITLMLAVIIFEIALNYAKVIFTVIECLFRSR